MSFVLTDSLLTGLLYIQRYRYLSINQVSYIADSKYDSTAHILRILERRKLLGHFGNVPFGGHGKAPKVYFLTRKGHAFLLESLKDYSDELGGYRKVKVTTKWSAIMDHHLKVTDVLLALEKQIAGVDGYRLNRVFLERKMEQLESGETRKETTDRIDEVGTKENKIIPDGAFILERLEDQRRFLFFLEFDNGTETIAPNVGANFNQSIQFKFSQYIRYLESQNYGHKYARFGKFNYFRMLFVTTSKRRVKNISKSLDFVKQDYRKFFYISDIESVLDSFFFSAWQMPSGKIQDQRPLITGEIREPQKGD